MGTHRRAGGDAGAGAVRDALPGLHGQALPREAGLRAWLRAELQLASPELAGARQDQAGAQARSAPPEAAAPTGGGDDAAPGRLEPRVGCGPVVGSDRDHGRCDIGGLFGLLRCRGGHDEHVPRARRGDRRKRAVLLALRRSGLALLAHARGRRRCGQGQPDPDRPGLGAARHRVDRGLFAAGPGPLGAHVRDLGSACPRSCDGAQAPEPADRVLPRPPGTPIRSRALPTARCGRRVRRCAQ